MYWLLNSKEEIVMICTAVLFFELYLTFLWLLWGRGQGLSIMSLLIATQATLLFPLIYLLEAKILSLLSHSAFFIMLPFLLFVAIRGSYWLEAQRRS